MKKLLKNKLITLLVVFLVSSGVVLSSKTSIFSSSDVPSVMSEKLALGDVPPGSVRGGSVASGEGLGDNNEGSVLGEHTNNPLFFTVNVPARFNQDISAPNVIYSLTGGSGISVSTFNGEQDPTIINTGVLSFQETTGNVVLEAGAGITIDGLKITGVSKNIFQTISVDGESDVVAGSSTDTLTFEGSGVVITTDAGEDKITFTSTEPDYGLSGWTDNGAAIVLTTITDTVTVDTITFGNASITNGNSFLPDTDLGSDIGSNSLRFNNLWVANLNSNSSTSFSGQTTFSYAPTDTTIAQASVIINPTTSAANGQLIALGIAGYQRALIDEDGDLLIGYNDATSAPANDYPLSIYGHSGTRVSFVDASGNANFTGDLTIQGGELYITGQSSSASTTAGTVFYDSDDNTLKFYDGSSWKNAVSDGKSATLVVAASDSSNTGIADYVASGNDDDATIETAIAALPAGGGKIVLLEGTFSIGDAAGDGIDITKSNVTIEGQGDATILQRQGSEAGAHNGIITLGDGGTTAVTNVTISNLAIDGNKSSYASAFHNNIYLNKYVSYSTIKNLYLHDTTTSSIRLVGASGKDNKYNIINNNRIANDAGRGISIEDIYNRNNSFSNNSFSEGVIGIYATYSNYDNFNNNNFYSTSNTALFINSGINSSIIGNTTRNTSSVNNAIYVSCTTCTIVGNTTSNSGRGIAISGSRNVMANNTISDTTYEGLYIGGNNNIIEGNNVYDASGTEAIQIYSGDGNFLSGNYITGSWTSDIVDGGTNTLVQHKDRFEINADSDIALTVTQAGAVDIINIFDGTTEVFTILDGGNLGIGTTTPTSKLHLSGAATGKALAIFDELGDQDIFTASSSGVPKFVIDNSGNVGIGYAAPTQKLRVEGDIYVGNNGKIMFGQADLFFLRGGSNYLSFYSNGRVRMLLKDTAIEIDSGGSPVDFRVAGVSSEENVLFVDSSANSVGMGTATPTSKLDITTLALGTTQTTSSGLALVNTTAAASGAQQISPAIRWSGLGWKTDATAASQAVDFRSFVVPVQGTANPTGYLTFQSSINGGSYSDGMVITSGGNVGIGTTDPTFYKFYVNGTIYSSSTISQPSTAGDKLLLAGSGNYTKIATDSNWGLNFYAGPKTVADLGYITFNVAKTIGWSEAMRIDNDGNVGIGNTPSYSLDVTGMMRATEGIATYTKAGTISDSDFSETAIDGQISVDSTNGRIYFRHSGAWHYVAQTAGFQIPEYETYSFSFAENKFDQSKPLAEGDFLIPFVDKYMEDGAIHGLYTKFSDVKGLLFEEETIRIGELEDTVLALSTAVPASDSASLLSDTVEEQGSLIEIIQTSFNLMKDSISQIIADIGNLTNRILALEDKSQNGKLTIPAEANSAKVTFSQEFSGIPQIYLTSNLDLPSYALSEVGETSFTIILDQVVSEDLVISWMATNADDDQSTIQILDNSTNLSTPAPVVPEETTIPTPTSTIEPDVIQEATQSGQI